MVNKYHSIGQFQLRCSIKKVFCNFVSMLFVWLFLWGYFHVCHTAGAVSKVMLWIIVFFESPPLNYPRFFVMLKSYMKTCLLTQMRYFFLMLAWRGRTRRNSKERKTNTKKWEWSEINNSFFFIFILIIEVLYLF